MRGTALRLLLAIALAFAAGAAAAAPSSAVERSATAVVVDLHDGAHTVATMPARTVEWAVGQPRSPLGDDHLVAVLVAVAASLAAHARRRAALVARWSRAASRGRRVGIRAPPAFV
jgi:hypothetical protein